MENFSEGSGDSVVDALNAIGYESKKTKKSKIEEVAQAFDLEPTVLETQCKLIQISSLISAWKARANNFANRQDKLREQNEAEDAARLEIREKELRKCLQELEDSIESF